MRSTGNKKTRGQKTKRGGKRNVVKSRRYARKKREMGGCDEVWRRRSEYRTEARSKGDREKRRKLRRIRLKNDLISRLVYLSVSSPLPLSRTDSRKKRMKMKMRMKKERQYSFDKTRTACAVSVPCCGILRTRARTFNEQIFSANVAAARSGLSFLESKTKFFARVARGCESRLLSEEISSSRDVPRPFDLAFRLLAFHRRYRRRLKHFGTPVLHAMKYSNHFEHGSEPRTLVGFDRQ